MPRPPASWLSTASPAFFTIFASLAGFATYFSMYAGWLGPLPWMIVSGAGLYVVYTPFNAMLFDRLVAVSGRVANAGFLIYVADSAGYAGSCALLLWRNLGLKRFEWLGVFKGAAYTMSLAGAGLVTLSLIYFIGRTRKSALDLPPTTGGIPPGGVPDYS